MRNSSVSRPRPLSIFLADDSALVREKLATLLWTLPNVEIGGQAGTVPQAIAAIAELRPDVVILDINMPGGSGLDVLRAVRRTAPATVMIVLTMHPYQQLGAGCAEAGADVYFEKNAEFGHLAAVLGILGRSSRSKAARPAALSRLLRRYEAAADTSVRVAKSTNLRRVFCLASALALAPFARAATWYVTQSGAGASDGATLASAWSVAQYNASATTTGAGDTVNLSGTITSEIVVPNGGASGNPLAILFAPDTTLTQPSGTALACSGISNLTIDGGENGVIQNTDNGTQLAQQNATSGIYASPAGANLIFEHLTIRSLYVRASGDPAPAADLTEGAGIYLNGYSGTVLIGDVSFSDVAWCITGTANSGASLAVAGCTFVNYDHGVAGIGRGGLTVTDNHFGSTANWDSPNGAYHHDGIHTYWGTGGGPIDNAVITENLFDGDWGVNNTAYIFGEMNYNTHDPSEAAGWLVANNVFIQNPGNYINDGFLNCTGNGWTIVNNTFLGASVYNQCAWSINSGTGTIFKNNLISGVNTFGEGTAGTFAAGGLNSNLYGAQGPGGNYAFDMGGTWTNSLEAWQKETGQDANSLNPSTFEINADGSISSASPACGAGTSATLSLVPLDFNGRSRPSPPSIGAIEPTEGSAATSQDTGSGSTPAVATSRAPASTATGGPAAAGAPVITAPLTYTLAAGSDLNYGIYASNSPTSFNAANVPEGLTVDTVRGGILGTPTVPGTYSIPMSATNAAGTGTATLVLTVTGNQAAAGAPVITAPLTYTLAAGSDLNYGIYASNSPTSFNAANVPEGLTVDTVRGGILGTPTVPGTYSIPMSATNAAGTGTATLVLTVTP